jgi:ketosteroid isomerase-like protein
MGVTENTQIVLAFFAALSRHDIASAKALLAEDATWWMPGALPMPGVSKSGEAVFEECLDYESLQVRHAIEDGAYVAVEWIARGKSPQGPRYRNYYHLITGFAVQEGKIYSIRDRQDMLYAKEVLSR